MSIGTPWFYGSGGRGAPSHTKTSLNRDFYEVFERVFPFPSPTNTYRKASSKGAYYMDIILFEMFLKSIDLIPQQQILQRHKNTLNRIMSICASGRGLTVAYKHGFKHAHTHTHIIHKHTRTRACTHYHIVRETEKERGGRGGSVFSHFVLGNLTHRQKK